MIKSLAKKIIPGSVWSKVRRRRIIREQTSVSHICDLYIDDYFNGKIELVNIVPKQPDLVGKRIIWQYWAQGYDDCILPEVVKTCFSSIDKYRGNYQIIRVCDDTISDYIDLPAFMYAKRGNGFKTHSFANVLRLALLYAYGGVWLDATVYMTGEIPAQYSAYDFFMYQRDENEEHKKYWENSFALYFGWGEDFIVRVLTSIIYSKPGCLLIRDWMNLMIHVWRANDSYPFYFIFPVMYNQLIKSGKSGQNCPVIGDCLPHYLMQIINDEFPYSTPKETAQMIPFHKLTYKGIDVDKFHLVMEEINTY